MEDIHDIKEPLTLSYNYLPLIIFFGGLLLLAALLLYLSFRKKQITPVQETIKNNQLSPIEKAINELEKIKYDKLIEQNKIDTFYNRITYIVKAYLYEQYEIEVESKTTTEVLFQIKSINLGFDFARQLEICLKDFDFAKYSLYKTTNKDMLESLDLAYSLFKLENR
mgnify:CR=1 FL=1